jgi:hypothetical protein
MAHGLAGGGRFAAQWTTELTDDAFMRPVEVDVLTDERCAAAVDAAIATGREGPDATAQQEALELLGVGGEWHGEAHAGDFRPRSRISCGRARASR